MAIFQIGVDSRWDPSCADGHVCGKHPPQYNTNCLSTVQCHTVQHNKIVLPLHNTIQNNPFQYNISLYSTIHHKIRHSIIQYNSLRYKKAYYNTVLPSVERNEFRSEPPVLQCQI